MQGSLPCESADSLGPRSYGLCMELPFRFIGGRKPLCRRAGLPPLLEDIFAVGEEPAQLPTHLRSMAASLRAFTPGSKRTQPRIPPGAGLFRTSFRRSKFTVIVIALG